MYRSKSSKDGDLATRWKDMKKEKEAQSYTEDIWNGRFYRLSTRRFIPEGDNVSRVFINLPSFTFCRHGSRLVNK